MAVTLFEDMADESKMIHQAFDLIYDKRHQMRFTTLDESHLFVQYSRKFASIKRREWGQLLGSHAFKRSGEFATAIETVFVAGCLNKPT